MWGAALAAFEDLTFAARDDTNLRLGAKEICSKHARTVFATGPKAAAAGAEGAVPARSPQQRVADVLMRWKCNQFAFDNLSAASSRPAGADGRFQASALYYFVSVGLNHSCDPSVGVMSKRQWCEALGQPFDVADADVLVCYARRDLPIGARLSFNYLQGRLELEWGLHARRELLRGFGFECGCERCVAEEAAEAEAEAADKEAATEAADADAAEAARASPV